MKLKVLRVVSAVLITVLGIAAFAYMAQGAMNNYAANHTNTAAVFSAKDAVSSEYTINLTQQSGVEIRFGKARYDNYLSLTLGQNDTYQAAFYKNREKVESFVNDSGPWAVISDSAERKPILHLIPAYIVKEGYDTLTLSILRGDGDYKIANVNTQTIDGAPDAGNANIIDYEIKQLEIDFSDKAFKIITDKRNAAIEAGTLLAEDADEVVAKVTADGKKYEADIRLKGVSTLHWDGDQWSFRIELNGDEALWGMQKFSIQNIYADGDPIPEYLIREWYRDCGGVSLRYDVADVYVNGEYKGIYTIQDFFEKRVVESSKKREGPIVKYDANELMWYATTYTPAIDWFAEKLDNPIENYIVFAEKKTLLSEDLNNWSQYAIDHFNRVLYGNQRLCDVFDLNLLAYKIAIGNMFQTGLHALEAVNARFYFNPVTALLEPIPYDEGVFANNVEIFGGQPYIEEHIGLPQISADAASYIEGSYMPYLFNILFADDEFRDIYRAAMSTIIANKDAFYERRFYAIKRLEIKILRADYTYTDRQWARTRSKDFLDYNAYRIGELLANDILEREWEATEPVSYTPVNFGKPGTQHDITGAIGYFVSDDNANLTLQVQSISELDILLFGIADGNGNTIATFPDNTVLDTVNTSDRWLFEFTLKRNKRDYSLSDIYLQYRYIDPDGTTRPDEVKTSKINPFKPYDNEVHNGTEIRTQDNLAEFDFVKQNGAAVTFNGDYIKLDRMLFIPKDKHLVLSAGQTIELTNGATIFCRSTITINGTESAPVRLISPDGTGDGLVVLQANSSNFGRSEVNWLICDNLDEVISGIYHLTGCVTFYESDVTIRNSQFLNNKSEDGLNIVRSDMAVENCIWNNTFQDAFDADFCTGYFDGCHFEGTGNDAFDVSTSNIKVLNCTFRDIHDKACSIGEASTAYIENIDVVNAQAVIGAKDSSQITAKNLRGENVLFGYLAYQKKPEFGHSTAYIEDFTLTGKTDFDYMIEGEEIYFLDGSQKLPRGKKKEAILIEKIINEEPIQ
jgi:hypothetical protein